MPEPPRRGALVRDTRDGRIGGLMDVHGDRWWLRPQGGGREWEVPAEHAEPMPPDEEVSAKVAAANRRSRSAA